MARAASPRRTADADAGPPPAGRPRAWPRSVIAARTAPARTPPGDLMFTTPYREDSMNRCLRRWPAGLVLLAAALPLTLLLTGCQAPSHIAEVVVVLPSATANEPAPGAGRRRPRAALPRRGDQHPGRGLCDQPGHRPADPGGPDPAAGPTARSSTGRAVTTCSART